jgi:hypothetical protein
MTENQAAAAALTVERRADGWWIAGLEQAQGPYQTKAEAREERRGLQRYLRNCHRRGFITTDSPRAKCQQG